MTKPLYANIKCENRQQLIKRYISLAMMLRGVKISEIELVTLAYFIEHGINQESKNDLIETVKIIKNGNTMKSLMTKLRSKGLIFKDNMMRDRLCNDLNVNIDEGIRLVITLFR